MVQAAQWHLTKSCTAWCVTLQVTQSHLSIATLTGEPLDKMKSVETAPMIEAVVLGKGADFSNYPDDEEDGQPYMSQVSTKHGTAQHSTALHARCDVTEHNMA